MSGSARIMRFASCSRRCRKWALSSLISRSNPIRSVTSSRLRCRHASPPSMLESQSHRPPVHSRWTARCCSRTTWILSGRLPRVSRIILASRWVSRCWSRTNLRRTFPPPSTRAIRRALTRIRARWKAAWTPTWLRTRCAKPWPMAPSNCNTAQAAAAKTTQPRPQRHCRVGQTSSCSCRTWTSQICST